MFEEIEHYCNDCKYLKENICTYNNRNQKVKNGFHIKKVIFCVNKRDD